MPLHITLMRYAIDYAADADFRRRRAMPLRHTIIFARLPSAAGAALSAMRCFQRR